MKAHLVFVARQDHTAYIVVKDDARGTLKLLKGLDVSVQQALQALIEEEVQSQSAGIGQSDNKAGETAAGLADSDLAKVGPVGLRLFSGKGTQLQKGFLHHGTETGHQAAQLRGATFIATGANHLEDASGAQARI